MSRSKAWIARPAVVVLSVAALAFGGGEVIDTVNVEVGARETVDGSLRPADERESFLIRLARGTTLKTSAKGTSRGGPVPTLDVLDPSLDVIAQSPAAKAKRRSRRLCLPPSRRLRRLWRLWRPRKGRQLPAP